MLTAEQRTNLAVTLGSCMTLHDAEAALGTPFHHGPLDVVRVATWGRFDGFKRRPFAFPINFAAEYEHAYIEGQESRP